MADATIPSDLSVRPCVGPVGGETIQFVDGDRRDPNVRGIYVSDAAFDLIEPILNDLLPSGSQVDRYGITCLPHPVVVGAIGDLRVAASNLAVSADAERRLFEGVADYFESVSRRGVPLTVLGY